MTVVPLQGLTDGTLREQRDLLSYMLFPAHRAQQRNFVPSDYFLRNSAGHSYNIIALLFIIFGATGFQQGC
jgi:hypothetical protein